MTFKMGFEGLGTGASIRGQHTFSVKCQTVNILGFGGHTCDCHNYFSPCALHHKSGHRPHSNKWVLLCSNNTLFTKSGSGWMWPVGFSLPVPGLEDELQGTENGWTVVWEIRAGWSCFRTWWWRSFKGIWQKAGVGFLTLNFNWRSFWQSSSYLKCSWIVQSRAQLGTHQACPQARKGRTQKEASRFWWKRARYPWICWKDGILFKKWIRGQELEGNNCASELGWPLGGKTNKNVPEAPARGLLSTGRGCFLGGCGVVCLGGGVLGGDNCRGSKSLPI